MTCFPDRRGIEAHRDEGMNGLRVTRNNLICCLYFMVGLLAIDQRSLAAQSDPEAAEAVVQRLVSEVRSSLDLPAGEQRLKQLTAAIEGSTDVDLLSRLALGRYWRVLDDRQQAEYQDLFRNVILGTLARRLEVYTREIDGAIEEHFEISSSKPVGRRDVLVRSQLQQGNGPPLVVDWRLRDEAIIDLTVEGVSLLISQRAEFASVVERSTVDGLIEELRGRVHR